jgi:UPF0716 protein FxsA
MVKWFIAAILLLPIAEIAAFVAVAAMVGVGWALTLMLATTVAGVLAIRGVGRGELQRLRRALAERDQSGPEATIDRVIEANAGGFLTVIGGFLLVLPGFLTDFVGIALLVGPLRRWLLCRWLRHHGSAAGGVVDLAPGEWQPMPAPGIRDAAKRPMD